MDGLARFPIRPVDEHCHVEDFFTPETVLRECEGCPFSVFDSKQDADVLRISNCPFVASCNPGGEPLHAIGC